MKTTNFESIIRLQESFTLRVEESFITFETTIENQTSEIIQSLNIDIESIQVGSHFKELTDLSQHIGDKARFQLKKTGDIFQSWSELLSFKPNLLNCPKSFYILDDKISYPSTEHQGQLKHYLEVISLIQLLVEHSDHAEYLSNEVIDNLTFLHKSRIDIKLTLQDVDLIDSLDGISAISTYFEDIAHKEQKKSIFKEALYSIVTRSKVEERLSYLIHHFGEFSKRFVENYQLFVSEFSFDEIRKEYEENKRDYFVKLDEILSSVQSKMLGIPISLALASFKLSSIVDSQTFWANLFLTLSIVIYSSMMVMLIKNQKHSLTALKSEFTSQMTRLKYQYSEQYDEIENMITDLNDRHDYQKKCLNWFYVMSGSLFIIVFALFLWNLPWKVILGI